MCEQRYRKLSSAGENSPTMMPNGRSGESRNAGITAFFDLPFLASWGATTRNQKNTGFSALLIGRIWIAQQSGVGFAS
jgi:hypothetical protein